jgi:basic membrane protein A and related proteins
VVQDFPDVIFEHGSGYMTRATIASHFGWIHQPRYRSGIVAGEITDATIVRYVAAFPIPEVIRSINAFTLGVGSINSDADVRSELELA